MKKKKVASTHKASHKASSPRPHNPHESPIIKFGVVFIYVFAIIIFSWALKNVMP